MKEAITDLEFEFKPEYSKPAILKQQKWLDAVANGLRFHALGVIVDADRDKAYVTFIQNKRTGKFLPIKDYTDKRGKEVKAVVFPRTAVPYEALLNYTKRDVLKHFHPDNPEVQPELTFEQLLRS